MILLQAQSFYTDPGENLLDTWYVYMLRNKTVHQATQRGAQFLLSMTRQKHLFSEHWHDLSLYTGRRCLVWWWKFVTPISIDHVTFWWALDNCCACARESVCPWSLSKPCMTSLGKPLDANQWSSGGIFISHLDTHDRFLYSSITFSRGPREPLSKFWTFVSECSDSRWKTTSEDGIIMADSL